MFHFKNRLEDNTIFQKSIFTTFFVTRHTYDENGTMSCTYWVLQLLTIQLCPQVVRVEKLKSLNGLEFVYMFLWHLRYLKQPQLILILDKRTTLSNTKHMLPSWLKYNILRC
ncbi:hypothetical protein L798_09775 [Zootermopsis nevadensis]|uniref:Uncharacterized protein n=1 Tax=Zootermopsis nevadensis TaxID=136037 RepID=A0A067QZ60_ZOONE|nr:hypothetical protein L798_09775 [Zootermopsis nevadensis]